MQFLTDNGIKYRKMLFFIKNILWNEKKAVPLHAELRAREIRCSSRALFINHYLGG